MPGEHTENGRPERNADDAAMADWPPAPSGKIAWSETARNRFAAVISAVLPPEEVGANRADVARFVGAFCGAQTFMPRIGLRAMSEFMYWLAPLVFVFKPRRFDRLATIDQEKLITRIMNAHLYPLRLLGTGLKTIAGIAVLGQTGAREALGMYPHVAPRPPIGVHVRWADDIEGVFDH